MDAKATTRPVTATGCKGAAPTSGAHRYRRSTLCKAPRKRTFIANMTKTSLPVFVPVAAVAVGCIDIVDNDDGCSGGGHLGGGNGGGNGGSSSKRFGPSNPGGSGGALPQVPLYMAGVIFAVAMAILSPATTAHAAGSPYDNNRGVTSGYFPTSGLSRPARKVRNVEGAIPYGFVELSHKEHRMISGGLQQLHTRETVRV